jgi:uncharacterized membrane protein YkvA (DUF1232 family)
LEVRALGGRFRPTFSAWKERARRLKRDTFALYLALKDPRVPWYARLAAGLVVAYAFSPIDLIPDFVPVLGLLDDLVIVPLGIALTLRLIPAAVLADARARAEAAHPSGKPVNWVVGAVIVVVWLLLAALVIALLVRRI